MAVLSLKILDREGNTLAVSKGEDFVDLVYTGTYEAGDVIELQSSEQKIHLYWQVDDALGVAFVYLTDTVNYDIPFGERRISYSPKVFQGNRHYLYARTAQEYEIYAYRNLAENPADQHKEVPCYPHASANVETRGESVFEAKNAIDGVRANRSHGEWPYASWGINRREDALMRLDFGRCVEVDRLVISLRADFPHDSWWKQMTVRFSDGSSEKLTLVQSAAAQIFPIAPRCITALELTELIKAEDSSPFPALTQIEVYGTVAKRTQHE